MLEESAFDKDLMPEESIDKLNRRDTKRGRRKKKW